MSSRPNSETARSTMRRQCCLVGDVAGDQHDAAAGLLDPARGLARVVFLLGQVGDQDIGAFAGEGDGHRAADAGIAAGDDRGAALELAAALVRLLAVVGLGRHLGRVAGRLLLLLGLGRRRAGVLRILGHSWAAPRGLVLAEQRGRARTVPVSAPFRLSAVSMNEPIGREFRLPGEPHSNSSSSTDRRHRTRSPAPCPSAPRLGTRFFGARGSETPRAVASVGAFAG